LDLPLALLPVVVAAVVVAVVVVDHLPHIFIDFDAASCDKNASCGALSIILVKFLNFLHSL